MTARLEGILSLEHLTALRKESGISDEVIRSRGYRTVTDRRELAELGFSPPQRRVPGLLLPLHTTDGSNTLHVYRPDNPRAVEDKRKGKKPDGTYHNKVIKYELPKGSGTRVDCPPVCRPVLRDPSVPLWIAEGQKKADSLASRGLCAIALLGVWSWRGKNDVGGTTLLADFDYVAFDNRDVRLIFDSDVMTKPNVRYALDRLREHLQRKKAHVNAVYLPSSDNGKVGVDDWLAEGHTVEELEALVGAPRPEPQPAAPIVELLDAPAPMIRRPLALVEGRAYAATWLPIRVTTNEGKDKSGNIIKYDPPIVETATRLFVIRDDGAIFGEVSDESVQPLADLGLEVLLPEKPPPDRLWSTVGAKGYRAGARPDPADVFNRVTDVMDRFLDFDRSLASQRTMAEMMACYTLTTWFLDALNVTGYVWPNGDRGSGKTHLLYTTTGMAYLGWVLLAGGSYASLRDLADYGATLAFDDAENLSDPRKSDPDKRALLLAGNRRGSIVTVKEPAPDGTWRTRYVNAFCSRMFSAIRLPDDVLASRSIVVPLIRTLDRDKANSDPLDFDLWPHDRRKLIDDLWALALAHLPEVQHHDRAVSGEAALTGRNLDPWRGILAVAHWLTEQGVAGLWNTMNSLSVQYQEERLDLEVSDLTSLVIRALCACAHDKIPPTFDISDVADISDIRREIPDGDWMFLTSTITERAVQVAKDLEVDIGTDYVTSRRVGRTLGKMRLQKEREPGTGKRGWRVSWNDLERWTHAYSISLHDAMGLGDIGYNVMDDSSHPLSTNVTNVVDATNVTEQDAAKLESPPEPEPTPFLDDPPPTEPCAVSPMHIRFWRRPTGGWVCARCHPPLPNSDVETWELKP